LREREREREVLLTIKKWLKVGERAKERKSIMSGMVCKRGCSCLPIKCVRVQHLWDSDFSVWTRRSRREGGGGAAAGRRERERERGRGREREKFYKRERSLLTIKK
jgi:hypothetical protein